jgi:hypothetical protein
MAYFLNDDFSVQSGALEDRVDLLGSQWTIHSTSAGGLGVVGLSHLEVYTPSNPSRYLCGFVPASADYSAELVLVFAGNRLNNTVGLLTRVDPLNSNTYYRFAWGESGGGVLYIHSVVDGVYTKLASIVVGNTDGTFRLRAESIGSQHKLFWNDVEKLSVTDSTVMVPGVAGLHWSYGGYYSGLKIYNIYADELATSPAPKSNPMFFGQDF